MALTGSNNDAEEDATAVDVEEATPRAAHEGEDDGDGSRRDVDVDVDVVDASDARAKTAGARAVGDARESASSAAARRSAASARRRDMSHARRAVREVEALYARRGRNNLRA